MKILTWNCHTLYGDRDYESRINAILDSQADVCCLQEVSEEFKVLLENLEGFGFYSVISVEGKTHPRGYNTTLSKININNTGKIDFRDRSINTRLFEYLTTKRDSFNAHKFKFASYIDIQSKGKEYRIFNIHLKSSTTPKIRFLQFSRLLRKGFNNKKLNIVCGDLNVISSSFVKTVNSTAAFNSTPKRAYTLFSGFDEREEFEKLFAKYRLNNVFRGQRTYSSHLVKDQLDHILIPYNITEHRKEIKTNLNSDHYALLIEFN